MRDRRCWAVPGLFMLCSILLIGTPANAQDDSVSVQAGAHYGASGVKSLLLGADYRDAWTTPIRVRYLDLGSFAGGLTATETGGGNQTRSLRFIGADGLEYTFRSVDKDPRLTDEPALVNTVVGAAVQDQVSSMHPAAALMVHPILEAVDILHPVPSLRVMPDDPALGEFRAEFAGMLGIIEARPDDIDGDIQGFGGFTTILDTETLFERLEESPENRVDARTFLTARLVDLLIGDWDRHADQWRWAEVERDGLNHYIPITRDRDYAFVDYDGLLMMAGRAFVPNAVLFEESFDIDGLTLNPRELDRWFLTSLDRAVWDSAAAFVTARVTDAVIDAAVGRLPPELIGPGSDQLASTLRWRRDNLGLAADRLYRMLATEVDIRGTDEDDLALVERGNDGTVRVRLFPRPDEGAEPEEEAYFDRLFQEDDTHEVRIYLQGDDDHAVIRGGEGESLLVRVIGGGSDDLLVDSSTVRGKTAFYDDVGENEIVTGRGTKVDTREYRDPVIVQGLSGESFRDWGSLWKFAPSVDYQSTEGLIIGLGRSYTRYGFRQEPYEFEIGAGGEIGLASGALALWVTGDFRRTANPGGLEFELSGSQLDPIHFYGFGNDTEAPESSSFYVVRQNRLLARASLYRELSPTARFSIGPIAKFTRTQTPGETPFAEAHSGGRNFGQVGVQSEVLMDWRDAAMFPRHGGVVEIGGSAYPAVWNTEEAFGEVHAVASGYTTFSLPIAPTIAVRLGAKQVWGQPPVHETAFLGGSSTIRGYSFQRYAGDAMVFGNAEARLPIAQVKLLVRGDLGVLGLADAGRVYVDGASPEDWHTAFGGGLWFRFQIRSSLVAVSASYAKGEKGTLYLKLGAPF